MSDLCSVTSTSIFLQLCHQGRRGFDLRSHREGQLFTGGVYYTTRPLIVLEAVMIVRGEKALFFPLKKVGCKRWPFWNRQNVWGHFHLLESYGDPYVHKTEAFPMDISTSYHLTHYYSEMIRVLWKKEVKTKSEIGSGGVHQKWWYHLKA